MAANYAWKGALELEIGGFPMQIPIKLVGLVKSRGGESFRTLDPKHKQPIHTQMLDINDEVVEKGTTLRGVETTKGNYVALTEESEQVIQDGVKTQALVPDSFCPLAAVDLRLAIQTYAVRPADDGSVAVRSLNTVWNGLKALELGYVSRLQTSASGRDSIIVVYGDERGLWAAALPFTEELKEVEPFQWTENPAEADAFEANVVRGEVTEFDHDAYKSHWRERRQQAIEAAVNGTPIEVKAAPAPQPDALDLMATIAKAAEATKKKPAKRKTKAAA